MSFPNVATCSATSRAAAADTIARPINTDNDGSRESPLCTRPTSLGTAFYGTKTPSGLIIRFREAVPESILYSVDAALRLAEQIIISPSGIQIAAKVLSGSESPDCRFGDAIRLILSKAEFTIVILRPGTSWLPALQTGPPLGSCHSPEMQDLIYFEEDWLVTLAESLETADQDREGWMRNLFYVAILFSHELILFLRRPLSLMLDPIGIHVPYNPPGASRRHRHRTFNDFVGGWDFEEALPKDQLGCVWFYEDQKEKDAAAAHAKAIEKAMEDNSDSFIDLLTEDARAYQDSTGFGFLAIRREEKRYLVTSDWIKSLHDAFYLTGDISQVAFPPDTATTPLDMADVKGAYLRSRRDVTCCLRR
ncbi:hypothetical protein IAU59_001878 [Kwoniella sp. CBS 9459]